MKQPGAATVASRDEEFARELATAIASEACRQRGWQLLDGTVSLQRFAPRWTRNGLRWRRMFRFEYSRNGVERRPGFVLLVGIELEHLEIYREPPPAPVEVVQPRPDDTAASAADRDGGSGGADNVVPFRKRP